MPDAADWTAASPNLALARALHHPTGRATRCNSSGRRWPEFDTGTPVTGAQHSRFSEHHGRDRLFWLPANGFDNGMDDDAWVPVLDVVDTFVATIVLFELRQSGVPAYAASVRIASTRTTGVRIWLGASQYGRGRSLLMQLLPNLIDRFGRDMIL
jgi:hypothetical protein